MAAYLDAWLEESPDDAAGIAKALEGIARAKGTSQVAKDAGLSRESLYRAPSADGNPSFATVLKVARALGVKLHAEPDIQMSRTPNTFYRFRGFNTATLDSLCRDTLHFAHPGTFNDPMDCSPRVVCDSQRSELRVLLTLLVRRRVSAEVLASLASARIKGDGAVAHAEKRAQLEAASELANIADRATNPEYSVGEDEAEAWLLTEEIERELRRHYDRGVCCFSATYTSPLLWSHYGDQHRGICVGYGLARKPVPRMQEVTYGGSRTIQTSTLIRAFVQADPKAMENLDRDILLRKAAGWRYEREWRLIGTQGVQHSPMLLKEITFGLRCEDSVKHSVVKALLGRESPIRFYYEMYEDRQSFRLRRRLVSSEELGGYLPITAASAEEMFGPSEEGPEILEGSKP